jgi:hypothetical protein
MGYEIIFHYKEVSDKPGVYLDEVKTKTCKVGKATEDVAIDVLAGKIMSQLVLRNILIVDVEIYEFAKKKLGYRESSDGIVIKNKKFSFDAGTVTVTDEFESETEEDFKPIPSPSREIADNSCPLSAKNLAPKRAIRQEIYDPDPVALHKAKQKGLKFTPNRKYPVFSEESLGSTLVYTSRDDSGKEVKVNAEYFVAIGSGLMEQENAPNYVGAENQKEEINLWNNYEQVNMPDIRRK